MDYRFMGKTGLKVPEISFGPGNNNVTDDNEGMGLIKAAFDLGINFFDPLSGLYGDLLDHLGTSFGDPLGTAARY